MATKTTHSIEEQVEDWCKRQFGSQTYYTKTDPINPEIEDALRKAPSKKGGSGPNFPDIKCVIETSSLRRIPVMIEVKGTKDDFAKFNAAGEVDNKKKDGKPNYNNIAKYAVNGAVHYADAILKNTESYKEVVAIGVNGYKVNNELKIEIGVYYVAKSNLFIPKKVGDYSDLSFLLQKNVEEFVKRIDDLSLTEEDIEKNKLQLEDEIDRKLKALNQKLEDEQSIAVNNRVALVAGLIMAGLGVENEVPGLKTEELRGLPSKTENDGQVILRKVTEYLEAKKLPKEKVDLILSILNVVFIHSDLQVAINGESKLKTVYREIQKDILQFLSAELHNIDFMGRLFNVMNSWVSVPDGDKNDVVLTPRYVTELMARLCNVDMDSYVWDFTVGSAGFLISAMNQMIKDAKSRIQSPKELEEKILKIKMQQLLGIEKLADVYMLAVLNMILMKDGSANIIKGNSLEYKGVYEQGDNKGQQFPATVFLLNPPYSAEGKGFIFVDHALRLMNHHGRAAILIMENAGSGNGLPFTKNILEHNTLVASIKMPSDLFIGKASVQTAIYVFDVNTPHNIKAPVKFIDFTNDGYSRQNRKKSSQSVNLRDTDNAKERYDELVNLVLYGSKYLNLLAGCYEEDTISLNGKDWTYGQHRKIDTRPTEADFRKVVQDYLAWKVSEIIKGDKEDSLGKL